MKALFSIITVAGLTAALIGAIWLDAVTRRSRSATPQTLAQSSERATSVLPPPYTLESAYKCISILLDHPEMDRYVRRAYLDHLMAIARYSEAREQFNRDRHITDDPAFVPVYSATQIEQKVYTEMMPHPEPVHP